MALGQLFSQRVGYAVHALCYMAKNGQHNGLTPVPETSEWMRGVWAATSETYLANVIQRLVSGGILVSQRGVAGGYGFARNPDEISLRDVVTLLEGVSSARCALTPTGECPIQNQCKNYQKLKRLQQRYADMLAELTIADMAMDMDMHMETVTPLSEITRPGDAGD